MTRKLFPVAIMLLLSSIAVQAEKKPLDHDAYDSWQSVQNLKITPDGKTIAYNVNPQEGDGELIFHRNDNGAEIQIARGKSVKLSQDGKSAVFAISAPFAVTRQAKIDKKKAEEMPLDTLAYLELSTLSLKKIAPVMSFKTGYTSAPYIYAGIRNKKKTDLIAYNVANNQIDTLLKDISSYEVSKNGEQVVVVIKKDKKDSLSCNSVVLIDMSRAERTILSEGKEAYTQVRFDDSGNRILFLATDQEEKAVGVANHSVFLTERVVLSKATRRQAAVTRLETKEITFDSLPESWVVSKLSNPRFSNNSKRIILSLKRYFPAKDTTLVSFETAGLDIWNWDALRLPPTEKLNPNGESLSAIIDLSQSNPSLRVLSNNPQERITIPDGGDSDIAISLDPKPYTLDNMWASSSTVDFSIINLNDGSRRLIEKALNGETYLSPKAKYLLWFNQESGDWYTISTLTGEKVNLTASTGVAFYDELDDHPMPYLPIDYPSIVGDDEYILINDRYDIWKFSPDGKKTINLTQGEGRKAQIRFRYTNIARQANPYLYINQEIVPTKGRIYLSAFSEETSQKGFYSVDIQKTNSLQGFVAPKNYTNVTKAANSSAIVYQKSDFRNPADVYFSADDWKNEQKLSSINPQQAEYRWGSVQLVNWQAYDGTELKGLLYTPDDIDPNQKYPMIVYFYEKYSSDLYTYYSPAPIASVVNFPFYVSRGYVVFIPDIVYKDGHPGESAYNCICSGAEAMCKQFSYIDSSRMAIQGQSWGGYQTAYLVTRTNMFAAAGAGAPVGNMTSAYGGIRWESGSSRIPQYEYGQSRIGKKLWDEGALDLYIENSPVFFADKVNTPVFIMHNDADGAVPWYQGIEFFMSLRRQAKPAWLLQYNNEAHNLMERRNRKDLSIRLQQFFDHYLQGAPQPAWMKTGIPYARKGSYFGTELVEE